MIKRRCRCPIGNDEQPRALLVESRHDDVKRSIVRLADRGVIQLPPLAEVKNHLGQTLMDRRYYEL